MTLYPAGGGWQDQVGGLVPGIKIGRSKAQLPLRVEVEQILVPDGFTQTLNDHLLLVYTGKTRLARNLLQVMPGCLWVSQSASAPPVAFGAISFTCAELCHPRGNWHPRLGAQHYLPRARRTVTGTFWPLAGRGEELVCQAALHRAKC